MLKKILSKPIIEYLLILVFNILGWIASIFILIGWIVLDDDKTSPDYKFYLAKLIISFVLIPYFLYNILFFLSSNKTFLTNMINFTRYRLKRYLLYLMFWAISPLPLLFLFLFTRSLFSYKPTIIESVLHTIKDFPYGLVGIFGGMNFPYTLAFPLILFFITLPWLTKLIDNYLEQDTDDLPLLRKNYKLRKEIVNSKAE